MKIVNKELLKEFARPGRCEVCGKRCKRREAHHIQPRGMGGGKRLDVRINLISLGASVPFPLCPCHGDAHNGKLKRADLFAIVGKREGKTPDEIEEELYRLMRTPK